MNPRFLLLTTFRRDGTPVRTPVWCAPTADGRIGVWTATDTGKVKRVRRSSAVEVAECDRRGTPLGPAVAGSAEILDAEGTRAVRAAVMRKYGLLGRILVTTSRVFRGDRGTTGLAVALTP
ncbi:PPOX class F420-dependent oxidoreductase [Pseudonocardia sp. WMMC193]|uniref:PPOX class F420-dependent oxidoreductase n=1 Tax=Pseudonocardia sp. WMMC193 TaxID=2911965 RepID=UPI001F007286|nr:PPOX class F420-dependent oxidoreductase [Pseudonocardia sp. WMMC193]MCF7548184.1 PPOX class F420-dependent oxidoreductase [Pseudonocardia sp. WMMC193]